MRKLILPAVAGALLFTLPAAAQDSRKVQAAPDNAYGLVRAWYRQFLDRDPDPSGVAFWVDQLRKGQPPETVLASILGSEEYYLRAGSQPQGFARALLLDLTGREPAAREVQDWVQRLRSANRVEVAREMLQKYGDAWRPSGDPAQRDYIATVQERTRRLVAEVERLQEDVVAELQGAKERELYRQADATLSDLRGFHRTAKAGVKREDLYGAFEGMDQRLHKLIASVRALGDDQRTLRRAVARVEQADQDLHYALSWGDDSDGRGKQVLQRQTAALLAEARQLKATARYSLADNRQGERAEEGIAKYVDAVEHFQKSLDRGADRDHLRNDFAAADKAWGQAVKHLNELPPVEGNNYLRSRALQVDQIHDRVRRHLGLEGERPRVILQYGTPR